MNYNIKIALDKIQGAHIIENFKTSKGAKKVIVIVLDENQNITDNQFGCQVALDMIAKKEPGKGGSHFIKETRKTREERDAVPFLGNAWENEYKPQQASQTESQAKPFEYNQQTEGVEDLPF